MAYPKLFERGKIGSLELKNRIVMPPMGCGFAEADGEASDEIIRYYEERAKGGCGLIITEITRVDDETGIGLTWQLGANQPKHVQGLKKLADAVHRHDSKVFVQLHHPGRETPSRLIGRPPVAPSAIPDPVVQEMPHELTTEECEAMVKKFVTGAVICQMSGIDGVELHGAHGYLINQFLSPFSNKRTDKYGGDFEGRMRFITEIIMGIKQVCGPHYPIAVRISGDEFVDGGLSLEDSVQIAQYLEKLGIAALDVSCGVYASGWSIVEPYYLDEGWKKHLAATIKQSVSIPVIAVNTVKHPAFAESLLAEGVSDFVSVGRGHLCDPEFGNKAAAGQDDLIRTCIGCLYCFQTINQGKPLACTVNPIVGRETLYNEQNLVKDSDGRLMVVIGGGPGGMQAAKVLADRGYRVTLIDQGESLGGTLTIGDKPPHKELIGELVATQTAELAKRGVDVRLRTKADPTTVAALNPYGVVIATGGEPIVPPIPGVDGENVVKAEDILAGKVKLSGKKILVIGGGVTGLETAEVLGLDSTNAIIVVEMADDVGTSLYVSVKAGLMKRLAEEKVEIVTGQAVAEIAPGQVTLKDAKSDETSTVDADVVVLAVGVRPNTTFIDSFKDTFDHLTVVGDANKSGLIADAMKEANDKAFVF